VVSLDDALNFVGALPAGLFELPRG